MFNRAAFVEAMSRPEVVAVLRASINARKRGEWFDWSAGLWGADVALGQVTGGGPEIVEGLGVLLEALAQVEPAVFMPRATGRRLLNSRDVWLCDSPEERARLRQEGVERLKAAEASADRRTRRRAARAKREV